MIKRDEYVLNEIATGKFYLREQLQALYFGNTQGPQKTQERLRKLHQGKYIKRRRIGDTGQYVYYSDRWSEKWRHWVALNWVKVALVKQAKGWQKVSVFSREYVYADLRADALACVDNTVQKNRQIFFVEVDNATNPFCEKYGPICEKLELSLETPWWHANGFPRVLVVTNRPDKVREIVKGSPVRYCVATLEEVRKDVYKCLVSAASSGGK